MKTEAEYREEIAKLIAEITASAEAKKYLAPGDLKEAWGYLKQAAFYLK